MSFGQAIKSVFSQYATFRGRARRSEYWWFTLLNFLVTLPGQILFFVVYLNEVVPLLESADADGNPSEAAIDAFDWGAVLGSYVPTLLVGLVLFLPGLAVVVRRLHDTGRSGWWCLLTFLPPANLVVFVFMFLDSQPYDNQYGPNPKAATGYPGGYPPQGDAQPAQSSYPTQGYAQPGYPSQPGYPTYPAQPGQAGYPAQPGYPSQPGYPVAPPPYSPPAASPGTNDPFATPPSS